MSGKARKRKKRRWSSRRRKESIRWERQCVRREASAVNYGVVEDIFMTIKKKLSPGGHITRWADDRWTAKAIVTTEELQYIRTDKGPNGDMILMIWTEQDALHKEQTNLDEQRCEVLCMSNSGWRVVMISMFIFVRYLCRIPDTLRNVMPS